MYIIIHFAIQCFSNWHDLVLRKLGTNNARYFKTELYEWLETFIFELGIEDTFIEIKFYPRGIVSQSVNKNVV